MKYIYYFTKVHPVDNDRYVMTAKSNPKLTTWEFSGKILKYL